MIAILLIMSIFLPGSVLNAEMYNYRTPLANKVDPLCYQSKPVRAWIYFTDKGFEKDDYNKVIAQVKTSMSRSAYERRIRKQGIIDYADVPLQRDYIKEIEALGGVLIQESKWLNAASFWIFAADIEKIANLDFVYKIVKVASFAKAGDLETALLDTNIFGIAYKQLNMFNIIQLHNRGFFGSGVVVGILDTGLRRKHAALENIVVLAEHDFLEGDRIYLNNLPISNQSGVFGSMIFHKTSRSLNLFLIGDTINNNVNVRDVLHTYSTDNGYTWSNLRKLTTNYIYQWVNDLALCGRDTLFLFFRHRYGGQVPYYDMKYMVVSDTTTIVQPTTLVSGVSFREPNAVQVNDSAYVVYHTGNELLLKKGDINGFSSGVVIDSSSARITAPKILVSTDKIGIFYHSALKDSLFFLRSSLPETTFVKTFLYNGKNAEVVNAIDTIYMIFIDYSNDPLMRLAFVRSDDFGTTFTNPLYLTDNINSFGKISLIKQNATIQAAWESQGRIYTITSYDNGNSFTNLDTLSNEFVYLPTLGLDNTNIIKFYCIRGDSITDGYAPDDPEYYHLRHGTEMLSLIGGYLRDTYIGVAPGVHFLVAKTENPDETYEFPIEEDTWIAGLEWFESKGVDIVNSSLGYTESYFWPNDFDGETSPASIAGAEAVKRGVIITNSVGNFNIPRIVVPADAQGVIAVGGIDSLFQRWESSGYFPTNDHSPKKPEIVCLSNAAIVVHPDSTNSYLSSSGTSGASALTAGICALLLEGHPSWNSDSVRNALFATASYADAPTDSMGYGWPDALAAFDFSPTPFDTIGGSAFLTPYPNPFVLSANNHIYIPFKLEMSNSVEIRIYSINGRLITSQSRGFLLPGRYSDTDPQSLNAAFIWDGRDDEGEQVSSGLYYCLLITRGGEKDITKIGVIK